MKKLALLLVFPQYYYQLVLKAVTIPNLRMHLDVTINGTVTEFDLLSATLIRSVDTDDRRFDISGKSKDGQFLLALTVGEETSAGNGVTVGAHEIELFNDDDPATPEDESGIMSNAFVALAVYIGSSTYTDVFAENGSINVTNCNEGNATISGDFYVTLESKAGGTDYTLTEGEFSNIKYTVIN